MEVRAASVNPVDAKIRSGGQRALVHYNLPWILGLDFSGVVRAVGPKVTKFAIGDEVFGSPTHRRPGTYAQLHAVDERAVAHKPRDVTHAQAASLPLVGLTAWNALIVRGRLRSGQRAFITAGSGGVGTFAIQLAKSLGCEVATTCSRRNAELVRSLGADHVIDYTKTKFEDELSGYDFVLDALGGEERLRQLRVLKRGGVLATMIGGFPAATKKHGVVVGPLVAVGGILNVTVRGLFRGVRVTNVLREASGEQLRQIAHRVNAGAIRPVIDREFSLDEIVEAHAYIETGRARGKIIIIP